MHIKTLTNELLHDFLEYCNKYGKEHDESYLPDGDFKLNSENPTYLLYNNSNELIGVVSLMLNEGRFRIFHSIEAKLLNYRCLFDKILLDTNRLKKIHLFLPEGKIKVREILKKLDFVEQRYSWYLEKNNTKINNIELLNVYKVKSIKWNKEENIWCSLINNNFKEHHGFSKLKIDDVKKMKGQNGKLFILWRGKKPIGTIQLNINIENGIKFGFISWLSINKPYRGMGLGRNLLRYAIKLANENMAEKTGLVVHSTNKNAVQLYQNEGFKKIESFICFNKKLNL